MVFAGECHWTGECRGADRNRNRRRRCWKARANRCGERTRHSARRTPDDSGGGGGGGDGVNDSGTNGGGNRSGDGGHLCGGQHSDGHPTGGHGRPETGVAASEQHFVGSGRRQAARARTDAWPAEQADAAAAAAPDQFQISGGVADHGVQRGYARGPHLVAQGLGIVVVGRKPAQPEGVADHRGGRRLWQTADARTDDGGRGGRTAATAAAAAAAAVGRHDDH